MNKYSTLVTAGVCNCAIVILLAFLEVPPWPFYVSIIVSLFIIIESFSVE